MSLDKRHRSLREFIEAMAKMRASGGWANLLEQGYAYSGIEEYLLRHGSPMQTEARTGAEETVLRSLAKRARPRKKECYANCQRLLVEVEWRGLTGNGTVAVRYAEGYALHVIPAYHAWLLVDGKVWDLTWELLRDDKYPPVYFGVVLDTKTVVRAGMERRVYAPVLDDWQRGWPLLKEKP